MTLGCLVLGACRVGYDARPGDGLDASTGTRDMGGQERDGDVVVPPDAPPIDAPPPDAPPPDGASPPPPPPDVGPPPRDAGPCGPPPATAAYCTALPRLGSAPVIDGILECGLALSTLEPAGWTASDPIPAGTVARFAYAWRPDGIYAFVDVDDPRRTPAETRDEVWCGAGAEIHIDADGTYAAAPFYDDPGTRQFIATAPTDDTSPSMRGTVYWTDDGTHVVGPWSRGFVVVPRPGGYSLEAFVAAADLALATWTLAPGGRVGIDLAINVAAERGEPSDCGHRLGQFFLKVHDETDSWCEGLPHCDVRAFCNPTLVE
ncbi:MAG: hypothetical protein IT379_16590 [Deltaproteobacteria bacterium]|nr:hypothetical protein [Deltaproteobacteria bacterium]